MYFVTFVLFLQSAISTIVDRAMYLRPFEYWMNEYNIQIQSEEHFYDILKKWIINELYIKRINAEKRSYTLGHNQFSGMDEFDFIQYIIKNHEVFHDPNRKKYNYILKNTSQSLPAAVDWVNIGYVTPVKDQGQCGSCWSFSTTGALEGAYGIKYDTLVPFSEQQLVDCDNIKNDGKDHGCNGGLMDNAFSWIHNNGGLCQELDYPYISGNGKSSTCQTSCQNIPNSRISTYIDVSQGDTYLMSALAQQPVSVAIQADNRDFQLYHSGVFTGKCGTTLDHGVLAVGYGNESGEDYYLVKNSWGVSWGENGYIKLGRGAKYNDGKGQCGILMEASYPVL
jgi:hypothetical protein